MNAETLLDLLQAIMAVIVLIGTVRLIGSEKRTVRKVFFALFMACILLGDLYWLAYDVLRPETRMPFAANEIVEGALFLLLGKSLMSKTPFRFSDAKAEIFGAVLFAAANTALWIGWSGEWVQDILVGAAYGYFLFALVLHIRLEEAYSALSWRIIGIFCVVLFASQGSSFFVPEGVREFIDLFCYVLMFAAVAVFLVRAVWSIIKKNEKTHCVCRTYAAHTWVITTMYMSGGGFHAAAMACSIVCFPLMYLALKKEVDAA